jgi:hypothetical protein
MSLSSEASELPVRMREIMAGRFTAKGLAIDDGAPNLYSTVSTFSQDEGVPIEIKHLSRSVDPNQPLLAAQEADFVVIDHRLEEKFKGYQDGLDVADAVRTANPHLPVFYCSAFTEDFASGLPGGGMKFNPRAAMLGSGHTYYYGKEDLVAERRLREFVQMAYLQALSYVINRFREAVPEELRCVLNATALQREIRSFRVAGNAGRGWTSIQELSNKGLHGGDVVPSRLLQRAGVGRPGDVVRHDIVEFDSGAVLSYFSPSALAQGEIAPSIVDILRNSDND